MFRICLLAALVSLALCEPKSIPYKNCKSKFKIKDVQVDPCPGNFRFCPIAKGSSANVRIMFEPDRDVHNLTAKVRARFGGMVFPYALLQTDACQNSNIECPLRAGQTYTYVQAVNILSIYPKNLVVKVNWLLHEESPQDRDVCVIFVVKVVAKDDFIQIVAGDQEDQ